MAVLTRAYNIFRPSGGCTPIMAVTTMVLAMVLAACGSVPDTPQEQGSATELPAQPATTVTQYRPMATDTIYDLLVAELAGHRNQYAIALENYQRQAVNTRDPQITAQATRLAHAVGSPEQAETLAALWLELPPAAGGDPEREQVEAHYIYAMALSQQGKSAQALEHMEQVGLHGGETAYPRIAADSLQHSAQSRSDLLTAINRALNEQPRNIDLLMAKSIVQQATDETAALATIRTARAIAPDNEQVIVLESSLLQQMLQPQQALDLLASSVARQPDSLRLRRLYARTLFAEDPAGAAEQLEILLQANPADPDTLFFLGLARARLSEYGAATRHFEQLLELGTRQSEAHFNLGLIASHQDQTNKALRHFAMVQPGPDFLGAMTQSARIYLASGQRQALEQFFESQRRTHPELGIPLYILESDVHVQQEDYASANAILSEALNQHPDDGQLLYARALVAEKQQDLAAAEDDLRQILRASPDDAMALNALGYLLTNHSNRYDEAQELIRRALREKPDDPTILDSMGWVHYRLGNLTRALYYLEQAYRNLPDSEIAAHLGEVLWQLGERERAKSVWREAVRLNPDHPVLRDTLNRFSADDTLGIPAP